MGANVGDPHPDVEKFAGDATSICAGELGKLSVNAMSVMPVVAELAIWNFKVDVPPATVLLGKKALLKVSAAALSTILAMRAPDEKSPL